MERVCAAPHATSATSAMTRSVPRKPSPLQLRHQSPHRSNLFVRRATHIVHTHGDIPLLQVPVHRHHFGDVDSRYHLGQRIPLNLALMNLDALVGDDHPLVLGRVLGVFGALGRGITERRELILESDELRHVDGEFVVR